MKKLVLTGAAGRLGSILREPLSRMADELVSTDIADDVGDLHKGERYVKADLADKQAIDEIIEGADMVIHFGAIVDEAPFETLFGPNFLGSYHVWEAAYNHKVRRVIYSSSIHAVGMYSKDQFIGTEVPHRPDSFYGLAKCFTEDLARMYWEKRGIESVHLRILSCSKVTNARMLGTWLSVDDLIQLVTRSIDTPLTGFKIVYGVSNNDRAPVDNNEASSLGYRPKDNAEQFAEEMLANEPPMDPKDPTHACQGGPFASIPLGVGVVASMNLTDDTE